jgi:hypothetical protein
MISILIPIYNYNAFPLLKNNDQYMEYRQDFEIICIDDCSSHFENENKFIRIRKMFLYYIKILAEVKIRNY